MSRFVFFLGLAFFSFGVCAQFGGTRPSPISTAYERGLAVWRQPDVSNTTCAFCHSPEGLEIAAYDFDDDTIRRRAKPHLGDDGAEQVVDFIHAVREKYHITKLLDPMKDRPLQPGGEVLPGKTPEERDFAFAKELQTALPTLAAGHVNTLDDAERAKSEMLALNPWTLRIGILFNRISEDGFHGKEHATFAHWIADEPLQPKFPWPTYFIVQDRYIRNPTAANLLAMIMWPQHKREDNYQLGQLMTYDKYRALLVYQHVLRIGLQRQDALGNADPVYFGDERAGLLPNPLLELGIFADQRSNTPFTEFAFPADTLAKKEEGLPDALQLKQMRLPALYAGWLMDQGLQRSNLCPENRATRIITERLFGDGPYPMHAAFFIARKLLVDGYVRQAWGKRGPQHFVLDFSQFLGDDNVRRFEPKTPSARAFYRRFVVNVFKMAMLLSEKDGVKDQLSGDQVSHMRAYISYAEPKELASFNKIDE